VNRPLAVRVAVVQLALEEGEVERNLHHVEEVVGSAVREHSPEIVVLPDCLSGPIVYSPAMLDLARQIDGEPYALLRRMARKHGCFLAGGFLAARGTDAKLSYLLAEPDGATHLHDRDQPTMWECNYASASFDDGFASTPLGPIGLLSGLEWIRSRTVQRLAGYVRLLLGGSCWWSPPSWEGRRSWAADRERDYSVALAREAPARMAQLVGAPAAVAHQVGRIRGRVPLLPGASWERALVGESQIVAHDGRILARVPASEGSAHCAAEVRLVDPEPLADPTPETFWLPVLPARMHAEWLLGGLHGRWRYRRRRAAEGFPWQQWERRQLLPYNPPDGPPQEHPERKLIAEPFGVDPIPSESPIVGAMT
jgi:predicted amidohydrolase